MLNKNNLFNKFKDLQNSPYAFSNHSIKDEEIKKPNDRYELSNEERKVLREQHLTIFENDETMQKMFKNDFEEYFKAVEDPDIMEKKYQEKIHNLNLENESINTGIGDADDFWDPIGGIDEFEDIAEDDILNNSQLSKKQNSSSEKKDKLYEKAFQWSVSIHKLCQNIYENDSQKDKDLFRVMVNATMVSAKIAYASDDNELFFDDIEHDEEFDLFEAELSLKGYTLAAIFLQRTRESLLKLIEKKFRPTSEWKSILKMADELVLDIQSKMVDLTKKLHPPRN